jgi:transposase
MKRLNRKEMLAIYHEGPEAVIAVWTILFNEIEALRSRVEQLENQGKKNSKNSHKPPSSDEFTRPKPKSLRLIKGRKPGGQKGYPGHTLQPVKEPHHLVIHRVTDCSSCGHSLQQQPALRHEKRQVFDLPPLQIEVTQHEAEVKICPYCQRLHTASFPEKVKRPVQYGPRIKALAVYLTQYQLLPYKRTSSFFQNCLGHSISEGTLVHFNREISEALEGFEETIHHKILASPVAHFDETGMRVAGERRWLHVVSTPSYTAYKIHAKRGQEAMDDFGILPAFTGMAVHDEWASYFQYTSCKHALCNVHHLRELTATWEDYGQVWAADMIAFLLQVKQEVEKAGSPCAERLQK